MSLRSAARGIVMVVAGAAVATAVAAILSPGLRRTALAVVGRGGEAEPEQPTHIVLPERLPASAWGTSEEPVERGDIALTGA